MNKIKFEMEMSNSDIGTLTEDLDYLLDNLANMETGTTTLRCVSVGDVED